MANSGYIMVDATGLDVSNGEARSPQLSLPMTA